MADDRTSFRPKSVAHPFDGERIVRMFLADTLNFVRRRRSWPEIDGDISDWILSMHGIPGIDAVDTKSASPKEVEDGFASLGVLSHPELHASQVREIHELLTELGRREGPKLQQAQRSGDKHHFDQQISRVFAEMLDILRIPRRLLPKKSYASVMELLRATRAILLSITLLHEHPLSLIEQASKGNRQAVLDLIKIDKMFATDWCCRETLRRAELQEDSEFLAQVQRALQYKRRIGRRQMIHLYLFALFLFEHFKVASPAINTLYRRLDPMGFEYNSLEAFEKDTQRRRVDFNEMLERGMLAAKVIIESQEIERQQVTD